MRTRHVVASILAAALLLPLVLPVTAGATEEQAVVGVLPAFPSGADYDLMIASLPGLGLLLDTNGNGQLNDEYCDTNGEANLALVGASFGTLVAAGTLCGALVSPAKEVCFGVLTVAALALQSNGAAITQCTTQDGFVDHAQAEAAYENTKILIASGLERNLRLCQRLVSLRLPVANGGRAEEVRDLVEFRIQQFEAAGGNPNSPNAASRARTELDLGTTDLLNGRFRLAFGHWCTAYGIVVHAGG
jgi:hypothetical protein